MLSDKQLDNKSFIYERDISIAFFQMARTKETRERERKF